MMKRVTCPHCGADEAVLITSHVTGVHDEFHCDECSSSFSAQQIIGMIYVGVSMANVTEIDLQLEKEEKLPQIMQAESVNNLVHEIKMKSFYQGKEVHVGNR